MAAGFPRLLGLALAILAVCWSGDLRAAEPTIRSLNIRGLRVGGTTSLILDGDEFGKAPRLLLPFGARQELKPNGTDKRALFDVALDDSVVPGYYHLRLVADGGVSLPVVIGVDRLPQQAAVNQPLATGVATLPVALHGTVAGSTVSEITFQGKARQKILVEVEAQRLGSKLRPIVHLYGRNRMQLAWAWGTPALSGDTRLEVVLPDDGTYSVSIHDAEYAAAAPSFFRLKLGAWSFIDHVFPPVLPSNRAATVELIGMARPVHMTVSPPQKSTDVLPLAWPNAGLWSGPRPFVTFSSHAELVNHPGQNKIQELPTGPIGISGRLLTPYGEDQYRLAVAPGQKLRFEVFAERIGSTLDAALVLRNDKGALLLRVEDSPGTLDPVVEYTVPDKMTTLLIAVVDAQGNAGPRASYRLTSFPRTADSGAGFSLTTSAQRVSLPIDGRVVFPVIVERRGYQGKIALGGSLPPGISSTGNEIPDGADGTLLTLARSAIPFATVVTRWQGRSDQGVEQAVVVKDHPLERLQPWLAREIALAPSSSKAEDFAIDWREPSPDGALFLGTKLTLPIKAYRNNAKATVKLTLLTSQKTPLLRNLPDPNKTLRQEKAVELPAKGTLVDGKTSNEGEITVLVPADLPAPVYDVTVQADLLAPDKKVLATAYAPVRRLQVLPPVLVKLGGSERIEVELDPKKGNSLTIQGKIERRPGLKADVMLVLTGLPAAARVGPVTLKAEATDFSLPVVLPPSFPGGKIEGLKLFASFAPDRAQPNVRIRSREVAMTLNVTKTK